MVASPPLRTHPPTHTPKHTQPYTHFSPFARYPLVEDEEEGDESDDDEDGSSGDDEDEDVSQPLTLLRG